MHKLIGTVLHIKGSLYLVSPPFKREIWVNEGTLRVRVPQPDYFWLLAELRAPLTPNIARSVPQQIGLYSDNSTSQAHEVKTEIKKGFDWLI